MYEKNEDKMRKMQRSGILKRTYKNCNVYTVHYYDISDHFEVLSKSDTINQNF